MSDEAASRGSSEGAVGAFGGQQIGLFERPAPPRSAAPAPKTRGAFGSTLRVSVLGSGSKGNSVLLEAHGRRLMVDCGFSCRDLEQRCRARGVELRKVDAIVLTHEHHDHCRGAARIWKRHGIPIYATPGTARGRALRRVPLEGLRTGRTQEIAGFEVTTFAVSHDAREPVGFVVESDDGGRVGVLADTGAFDRQAARALEGLHGLVLESNHDPGMLRTGPYPWALKQRVAGRQGHLSNEEAAEATERVVCDPLQWVVAYHLSEINNMPVLAKRALSQALARAGSAARVELALQDQPLPWLSLSASPRETHVLT